jgi:hypothetical protein
MELFASKTRRLGKMMKHDSFYLVITCSRRINGNAELRKRTAGFLDCWVSFIEILETMSIKAEELSDELALSLARILFIAALVFDMPEKPNIENIISDPNARRLNGTFPASIHDIEFSKTLPGDLKGPFESGADIFMNLRANLYFYLAKMG